MSGERQNADGDMTELSRERGEARRHDEERRWFFNLAVAFGGLAVSVFVLAFTAIWWASNLGATVATIAATNAEQSEAIAALEAANAIDRSIAARLDERLNALAQGQARIEAQQAAIQTTLDRLYRSQNGGSSQ
jgi:hypothetical protein